MVRLFFSWIFLFLFIEKASCFNLEKIGKNNFNLKIDENEKNKYIQIKSKDNKVLILERNNSNIKFQLDGKIGDVIPFEIFIFKNGFIKQKVSLDNKVSVAASKRKDIQILVEISKQKITYGDGALIKYSLLSDYQYVNYRVSKFPAYEGFIKRFVDPGNSTRSINFEGRLKYITPLYHVELFPLKGKKQIVYDMEIIVDENTERESLLVSENPKFTYVHNNSFDPYKGLSISDFKDIQINDKNELKQEVIFSISGTGLVENVTDIKFKGDAIKGFQLRLYNQEYRPGFGRKEYKAFLELLPYKNSQVDVYIEGKKFSNFFIDTFLGSSVKAEGDNQVEKLIVANHLLTLFDFLIMLGFIALSSLFVLRREMTSRILIFTRLFRLYLNGKIPFNNFYAFNDVFFPACDKNWYFLENLIVKYDGDNDNNTPDYIHDTHDKIKALLEGYKTQVKQNSDKNPSDYYLGFVELYRYLIFLQKESKWKC